MIRHVALPIAALALLTGCNKSGEINVEQGVGITAVRSACPVVGVPAGTGDVTMFDPPASRAASAIDVTAVMSNVRSTCDDTSADVVTTVTFDVRARRSATGAPREIVLPYFITIVRGGNAVVAKRVGRIAVNFAAGESVATVSGQASANVSRAAATLPDDVRKQLTRKRKAGDEDAALDPLATPAIRQAVLSVTFEALVGFQLTEEQLKYNAQR